MRVKIIPLFILCIVPAIAQAATTFDKWWERELQGGTICQIDETRCYTTSNGIDMEQWDALAGCRGMKYICPNALTADADEPVAMERAIIAARTGILSDFDTNIYVANDNCYGARRTKNDGSMVSVNGNYVRVWCNGILENPAEETLPNGGQFTTGTQPTCAELAEQNIAAILNGKCYGKRYNSASYAINCNENAPQLVLLNGANYNPTGRGLTSSDASSAFNSMVSTSAAQRGIYFNR